MSAGHQYPLSLPPRPTDEIIAERAASPDAQAVERQRILDGYGIAAKQRAHLAFVSYHTAVAAGDMELAEAAWHRFDEASRILRHGRAKE
ncbi:MAG: hypothetical protein H7343_20330 [Undibacterium sp.]|nr:hypothetical protein [Opitutaceae bacterium]